MANAGGDNGLKISGALIKLLSAALALSAAYFLTIQSLRIELAEKAESTVVELLDKKLGNIEVILREGVVSKEQFYSFSTSLEARLARIEYYLAEQKTGDEIGND